MKNRKFYILAAVFVLLLSGLFSSCIIIASDSDELYNFDFVNDHILECNYSGTVTNSNIEYISIYDSDGNVRYASVSTTISCKNSRVTFVLDRDLQKGWYVKIKFKDVFGSKIYKVYYK